MENFRSDYVRSLQAWLERLCVRQRESDVMTTDGTFEFSERVSLSKASRRSSSIEKFATSVSIAAVNIATPCLPLTTSSTKSSISFLIVLDDDEGPPQPVAAGGQGATVLTPRASRLPIGNDESRRVCRSASPLISAPNSTANADSHIQISKTRSALNEP